MKRLWMIVCLIASQIVPLAAAAQPQPARPVIDSIDPPDWFVTLPEPMLLVHGSGLDGAHITISGQGVSLGRVQTSTNGHWAFLWLTSKGAPAQTIEIKAANAQGSAEHSFALKPRTEPAEAHAGFTPDDVIYLIMTDRFADGDPSNNQPDYDRAKSRGWHGGDLAGIEKHLDYLQGLGITALWTTPVYDNGRMPESYHGYAATNLYAVDRHFGTLEEYRHLSAALHARHMKLIIDLVPNHIGVLHPWITDPPAPDWFHGTLANHTHAQGDFHTLVDPHATPASSRQLTEGWFVDSMPDMNQENPLVSQYLIQNALWWVETAQIDAIRIDTFPYVGRAFWHDFHAALHEAFPRLTTVGEIFHGDATVTSFFAGGREHAGIDTGLDTPFDFPVYFKVRDVLAHDKPISELAEVLEKDSLYPHPERLIPFFGNHDTTRFLTEAHGSLPRLREAIGLMATLRGTPELYSGDEIAMEGKEDPDNRRDFPGGFADGQPSAFEAATRTAVQQSTYAWTAALLAARKEHGALRGGQQQDVFADDTAFAYVRSADGKGCDAGHTREVMLAAVNKKAESRTLAIPMPDSVLAGCSVWSAVAPADKGAASVAGGVLQLTVPGDSFVLFSAR
jgi:glycosidase